MVLILSDADAHLRLQPLTFTRPVGALLVGAQTNAQRWAARSGLPVAFHTDPSLDQAFPRPGADLSREVHGGLFPHERVVEQVLDLLPGEVLLAGERPIAFCYEGADGPNISDWKLAPPFMKKVLCTVEVIIIDRPWHLFQHCGEAIRMDHEQLTKGRPSAPLSATNTVIGDPELIFLEPGAKAEHGCFNTTDGPIYLAAGSEVMEGALIRGPFVLGEHATLKMGCKIYGPTSIGPHSKVGGEVNNSVVMGYSNKAHDGFLGNSVLGEWCNLGADTNNSNLKNNYGDVRVWSYEGSEMVNTGLQFCGLIMGDHSKSGINTMFNTGTVVGVCANVFGAGFPPKYIPSFSWGGAGGLVPHELDKALGTARKVMARRGLRLEPAMEAIMSAISKSA